MPATAALVGKGTTIWIKDENGTYTKIGEVKAIKPPNAQSGEWDATHLESPSNVKEFLQTSFDAGEATFRINLVPGGATAAFVSGLHTGTYAGARRDCKILFANLAASTCIYSQFIKGFDVGEITIDGGLEATVTQRVVSLPVWA